MNENLSVLPRLLKQNALTKEQVNVYRSSTGQMKQWAKACSEPMSLGAIHAFARTHWVSWHVRIIGSNSVPLQIFLYLCEKRRLQSSEDLSGSSEYEGLVGALLEDQRVAPHLLMNGRPRTVLECITALRHWCHLPTLDGDRLSNGDAGLTREHAEAIENSSVVRNTSLLGEDIAQNGFCVTKEMYARLPADERKKSFADDTTLLRYLNWEMSAPSCLKLESALFKAIQNTSEWEELRVAALLSVVRHEPGWLEALFNVLTGGLETLSELQRSPGACGVIVSDQSLGIAALKAALRVPGYEESLKVALANAARAIPGWKDSFAENLLIGTMSGWRRMCRTFNIEPLSRSLHVNSLACIQCLFPQDRDLNKRKKGQNEVIEELLEGFMREARPVLEEAYGKNPSGSIS